LGHFALIHFQSVAKSRVVISAARFIRLRNGRGEYPMTFERHFALTRVAPAMFAAILGTAFFAPNALVHGQAAPANPAQPKAAQAPDAAAPAAGGSKWKEIAITRDYLAPAGQEWLRVSREINSVLSGDTTLDENGKQVMDGFFAKVKLAELTHVANLTKLHEKRISLRQLYIRRPRLPDAVHTHLNELIFTNMTRVAHDNGYHPAVRVNAMLMVAELNQKEAAVASGAQVPAVPLPSAMSGRGGLLESAEDTTLHPAVRAMALYGIQRHADAKIPAGSQANVMAKMAAILKEKPLTAGNTQGAAWLKARAADVLATMGATDASGAVPGELATIVIDAAAPIDLRCAAAKALGAQKGLAAGSLKLPELVPALGNLHLEACRAEIDRAAYELDTVAPKQIFHRASAIQAALGDGQATGVTPLIAAGDAQKALADAIAKNVTETLALVPDENADPTEQVKLKADELEKILADAKVLKSQPRATAAPANAAPAADAPATTPADAATPADATAAAAGAANPAPAKSN
jgi:hypothetical protein